MKFVYFFLAIGFTIGSYSQSGRVIYEFEMVEVSQNEGILEFSQEAHLFSYDGSYETSMKIEQKKIMANHCLSLLTSMIQ